METKKRKFRIDFSVILVLFFCVLFIYQYVDGVINIATRNKLEESGYKVLVTVTDAEYVTGGENDYYLYTMEYEYNGKDYSYVDSSDRDLELGEQLTMYVDPNEPEKLNLPKDSMYLSFIVLGMAIGSMYLSDKFKFLKRKMWFLVPGLEVFMIITGVVLKHTPVIVVGFILVLLTFVFWLWLKKIKKQNKANV